MKALEFANKWYKSYLPKTLGSEFNRFAAGAATIAERIAIAPIKIDQASTSAYTDGKTITLPGVYFLPEFYQELGIENPFDKPAAAITAVNGSTIHEALHIMLSECDMREMVKGNSKAEDYLDRFKGFGVLLGLVEDLFIENYGASGFKRLNNFVVGKNDIIFPLHSLESRLNTFADEPTQSNLLNVLFCRKNTHLDKSIEWEPFTQYTELLNEAKDLDLEIAGRVDLAVKVFELMNEDEQLEHDEQFNMKGDPGTDSEGDPYPMSIDSNEYDSELKEMIEKAFEILEKTTEEFENAVRQQSLTRFESISQSLTVPEILYEDVLAKNYGYGDIVTSREFASFAQQFRYMYEEKHTLGRPNTSGTKIMKQRLHRILTDSKVLAYHDRQSVVRGKPKIIILMDASGSTGWNGLWSHEIKAAWGAFQSLQKAGISVAVYAHTSVDRTVEDQPVVFGIVSHNMPLGRSPRMTSTSKNLQRFQAIKDVRKAENFDGYAIDYVCGCFPNNPGTNLLIVMSDGTPAGGYRYGGEKGIEHTIAAVTKNRSKGIKILSLSLVRSVMESNDRIYGKEFNAKAWDGQLERSLQNIMLNLLSK